MRVRARDCTFLASLDRARRLHPWRSMCPFVLTDRHRTVALAIRSPRSSDSPAVFRMVSRRDPRHSIATCLDSDNDVQVCRNVDDAFLRVWIFL